MIYRLTHNGIIYGKYSKEQVMEEISKLLNNESEDDFTFFVERTF